MSLEGSLRDFSVGDICLLLSRQRKTGFLAVEGKEDTVTVAFQGGQIVSADSAASSLNERVGKFLVRAGKLSAGGLLRALEGEKQAGQRLGALLLRDPLLVADDLREAVRIQVIRIILGSLSWKEGRFQFRPEGLLPARDPDFQVTVGVESLLAEEARAEEERSRLQQKVASHDLVLRRAPGVENLSLVTMPVEPGSSALHVSAAEAETWKWINGERRVSEILEGAFLADLEVYRGLADLLDRHLVEVEPPAPVATIESARRPPWISARAIGLWTIFLLLSASAVREVPQGPWNLLLKRPQARYDVAGLLKAVSLARLASIERAVRVYYDASGHYPRSLEELLATHVLDLREATDPYGRPYRYILLSEDGKFSLFGRNQKGEIDLDLSFDRSLAPVSGVESARGKKPSEHRPEIQIIR
jgi:hypothetical protein